MANQTIKAATKQKAYAWMQNRKIALKYVLCLITQKDSVECFKKRWKIQVSYTIQQTIQQAIRFNNSGLISWGGS